MFKLGPYEKMRVVTYYSPELNVDGLDPKQVQLVFAFKDLSRQGNLNSNMDKTSLTKLKKNGFYCSLEFDILVNEKDFNEVINSYEQLSSFVFDSIRLQDPGLIHYFKTTYPELIIDLILETGNHNVPGVTHWESYLGKQLGRIILSIELSRDQLKTIVDKVQVPVEILGLGPILVFYTPRKLLSHALGDESLNDEELQALGTSEESPHRGFPLVENQHGTYMYHIKDFSLTKEIWELETIGINYFRMDPRLHQEFEFIHRLIHFTRNIICHDELMKFYPKETMKGYYRINKSNVLFKKLKNSRITRVDLNFCGRVLEVVKDQYIAIEVLKGTLSNKDSLHFITPEGKEISGCIKSLRSTELVNLDEAKSGKLVLINFIKGVWPKSSVFYHEKSL